MTAGSETTGEFEVISSPLERILAVIRKLPEEVEFSNNPHINSIAFSRLVDEYPNYFEGINFGESLYMCSKDYEDAIDMRGADEPLSVPGVASREQEEMAERLAILLTEETERPFDITRAMNHTPFTE